MIDKKLMSILACPVCHEKVSADENEQFLVCVSCGRAYPVKNGIPVMLADQAVLKDDRKS